MKKTIAELLKELKTLDSRITNGTNKVLVAGIKIGGKVPTGYADVEELNKAIKSGVESLEQLIKNRSAIKSALVLSNAVTKVSIAGVEMTVAEAIEFKSSIIYKKALLSNMEHMFNNAKATINKGNADMKVRLDNMLIASRGKEGKADADADKAFSDTFTANNQYELVDPLKIIERTEMLREEITSFEDEVDVKLQISNAITEIEIN